MFIVSPLYVRVARTRHNTSSADASGSLSCRTTSAPNRSPWGGWFAFSRTDVAAMASCTWSSRPARVSRRPSAPDQRTCANTSQARALTKHVPDSGPPNGRLGSDAEWQLQTRLQLKADRPLSAPCRTFRHALGEVCFWHWAALGRTMLDRAHLVSHRPEASRAIRPHHGIPGWITREDRGQGRRKASALGLARGTGQSAVIAGSGAKFLLRNDQQAALSL